jgi:hypothetical protein
LSWGVFVDRVAVAAAPEFDEMTLTVAVTVFVAVTLLAAVMAEDVAVTVDVNVDVRTANSIRGRDEVLQIARGQRPTTASPMMSQYEAVLPQFTAKLDLAEDTIWYSA